jgi:hypothetical protein
VSHKGVVVAQEADELASPPSATSTTLASFSITDCCLKSPFSVYEIREKAFERSHKDMIMFTYHLIYHFLVIYMHLKAHYELDVNGFKKSNP